MGYPIHRLSARSVANAKRPGRFADGGGLYLLVKGPSRDCLRPNKWWVFRFRWDGRRCDMGLGAVGLVDLEEARALALAARKLVHRGTNPIEERRAKLAQRRKQPIHRPTFGRIADEVIEAIKASDPNPKHLSQWKTSLEVHAKPLRDKLPSAITTDQVLGVLQPIWLKIPETAARTRGRIERVLDAAKAKKLRAGENPARWKGHLALLLPKQPKLVRGHHPALPYAEIGSFMDELRSQQALSARALEFTIQTVARTGEALGARWNEFDLEKAIWTVPPERMKLRIVHRVALCKAAVAMLRELLAQQEQAWPDRDLSEALVFPSDNPEKPLSNMAMQMLLRRMGRTGITVHGFRSTFRDWAGEETIHQTEVIEAALAHLVGTEVERAYRRGDALEKRSPLMEDWSTACSGDTFQLFAAA
jgi:integrase